MSSTGVVNKALLALRFVLCVAPLTGYIHPDEFFQSSEVVASDLLGLRAKKTWEWNETSPTRSIVFPAISSGLPFLFVRLLRSVFGISYTTYSLLVLPRLVVTLFTLLIDISIEKMTCSVCIFDSGKEVSEKRKDICIFLFRSSTVTMVFLTRTFSNTAEAILLALFLWQFLTQMGQGSFATDLNSTTVKLAAIVVLGFFIRPTFLLFAAPGCFLYIIYTIKNGKIILQAFIALSTAVLFSAIIICMDSSYFSSRDEFSLKLTPLNFIRYNLEDTNLEQHGKHGRFLHIFLNCPLLFGPMFAVFILSTADLCLVSYNTSGGKKKESYLIFLACSTWLSLFFLSYFKHQEPRFIIPVISAMSIVSAWTLERRPGLWNRLFRFWVIFNLSITFFFGFVHQGGVIPCLSHLNHKTQSSELASKESCTKYDVLFWYTYMAPQHLIPPPGDSNTSIVVHSVGSLSIHRLEKLMDDITNAKAHEKADCLHKVSEKKFSLWRIRFLNDQRSFIENF